MENISRFLGDLRCAFGDTNRTTCIEDVECVTSFEEEVVRGDR